MFERPPALRAPVAAFSNMAGVMSMLMTRPDGPTWPAAIKLSNPAPQPTSSTVSPGRRSPIENGLPVPANDSTVSSGSESISDSE